MLHQPKTTPHRKPCELAAALDVTPAAIYGAIKKGYILAIPVGSHHRIPEEVFDYHARNGYGAAVPPFDGRKSEVDTAA